MDNGRGGNLIGGPDTTTAPGHVHLAQPPDDGTSSVNTDDEKPMFAVGDGTAAAIQKALADHGEAAAMAEPRRHCAMDDRD